MDHPLLVPSNTGNGNQWNHNQTYTKQPPTTARQKQITPITEKSNFSSSINIMEIVSSNDILQTSLRPSTILKHKTYQTKWNNYCIQNKISHMQPKISELLDYFTHLYNSGAFYSVLNSRKSALSHIVFLPPYSSILKYPQIIKYFKGFYNLRRPT